VGNRVGEEVVRTFKKSLHQMLMVGVLACMAISPAYAERNLVPAESLERQAQQQYAQLLQQAASKKALAPASHPQVQRLRAIAKRMLPFTAQWNSRSTEWAWEVNLIGSKQINAFCMPGGKIAFYSAILDQLKLTDDEVAMVMGHEIAHALREHSRERAAKSNLTNMGANILSQVLGVGQLGNMAIGAGAQLLSLKFSRSDESEADLVGMDLAARAGFNPRAGVTLWQKMSAANSAAPLEFLSTHPSGDTRIEDIEQHLPEVLPLYEKAVKDSKTKSFKSK
jgi:Zn-dependent protease with chaperone function